MAQDPVLVARLQKMHAAQTALEVKGTIPAEKLTEWALLEIALVLHGIHGELHNLHTEQVRAATHRCRAFSGGRAKLCAAGL